MTSQPLQFQGQYNDTITGLYDMRMRDYNPATGGFTNTDPVTAKPGTPFASTYNFAYNQPTTLSDPSGACPWCLVIIVVGVASLIGGAIEEKRGGNVAMGMLGGAATGASLFIPLGPIAGLGARLALNVMGKGTVAASKLGTGASAATAASSVQASSAALKNSAWALANSAPAHLPKAVGTVACVTPSTGALASKASKPVQGIYEFFDIQAQKWYVGRSVDIARRLKEHERTGRIGDIADVKITPVEGGIRELRAAEQVRINLRDGIDFLANMRNEIAESNWAGFGIIK